MEEWLKERFDLASDRISEIPAEKLVQEPFLDFFQREAEFILCVIRDELDIETASLDELKGRNQRWYQELLPENYGVCYGNPEYAVEKLGEYGRALSFLYAELRGIIIYHSQKKDWDLVVSLELFLEVYSAFQNEDLPSVEEVIRILDSYVRDYTQEMIENRIAEAVDPDRSFLRDMVMQANFSDVRYLYRSGEYIGENELRMAEFLGRMSKEKLARMASTFTEGYRIGFLMGRKDLSIKKTVNVRFQAGFEPMIHEAVRQFEKMGLQSVIYGAATHIVNKKNIHRIGYLGGNPNPQFDYDHRQDAALFLDSEFSGRKLRAMQNAYEKYKVLAKVHGGPAVMETFGEKEFNPVNKKEVWSFSEAQIRLQTEMDNEAGQIVNRYIPGEERSFTIIAYPIPEIGEQFEEIFEEIVKVNTLDYKKYQDIQQTMIQTLDTCEWVEIKGQGENETDLLIHLHELEDIRKQTNFENCVADVNIPVGEVFTSPQLAGTGGVLHVSQVYLNGLLFKNLKLTFDCGQVIDYTCENFETEEENRAYIEDHILFHHQKIPMGEFAIGTNTTAYVMAKKYQIADKLPILIAEKTGPHFAVGDTCYSWSEDTPVYNADGREIIARDNEISALRKEDLSLAYFGCHTDITIPYEELGSISVIDAEGERIPIIENGRFVLTGTEELNEPFDCEGK